MSLEKRPYIIGKKIEDTDHDNLISLDLHCFDRKLQLRIKPEVYEDFIEEIENGRIFSEITLAVTQFLVELNYLRDLSNKHYLGVQRD